MHHYVYINRCIHMCLVYMHTFVHGNIQVYTYLLFHMDNINFCSWCCLSKCQMYVGINDFLDIWVQVRSELRLHWKCKITKQETYAGTPSCLLLQHHPKQWTLSTKWIFWVRQLLVFFWDWLNCNLDAHREWFTSVYLRLQTPGIKKLMLQFLTETRSFLLFLSSCYDE